MGKTADSQLIQQLRDLEVNSKKRKKLVSSSTYAAPADPATKVQSWKLDENKFYNVPSPFPTLARGLFTTKLKDGQERVVARGYDKFFNIGEVPWATWGALGKYTVPPYDLTLKSNGCIILIAALAPDKLLITSKHSLGSINAVDVSHAQKGEEWLLKHLESKGKNAEQLAGELWEKKWTAVAELCDDSFEEHVLPYSDEVTGLHLHGFNTCASLFSTQPPAIVSKFATEWGFIPTKYETLQSISEVRAFTEEVAKTGVWNGSPVEGFVVRTHLVQAIPSSSNSNHKEGALPHDWPPYQPGSNMFFKVKFGDPYMMYRDWREITKMLLNARSSSNLAKVVIPKSRLRHPESALYHAWVQKEIEKDRSAFIGFAKGKGIISTRERFLAYLQTDGAKASLAQQSSSDRPQVPEGAQSSGEAASSKPRAIIMPIAIPGCGKTAIAIALKHLFGFGHTQNDDVKKKNAPVIFQKRVHEELAKHGVVFADKNNHLRNHRKALTPPPFTKPPINLIALHWPIQSMPAADVIRICSDRIIARGDNHQNLRPEVGSKNHHENVLSMFVSNSQPLDPEEVDEIIEMDITGSMEANLQRAVDGLVRILGLEKPTEEKMKEAVEVAKAYAVPDSKKSPSKDASTKGNTRYFAIVPRDFDMKETILALLRYGELEFKGPVKTFWNFLEKTDSLGQRPHLTITHKNSLPLQLPLWNACYALDNSPTRDEVEFEFRFSHLIANQRAMALVVDKFRLIKDNQEGDGQHVVDLIDENSMNRLHVTVGTGPGVKAVEAGALVREWRNATAQDLSGVDFASAGVSDKVVVTGVLKGCIQ